MKLDDNFKEEVVPKNILMIGPTGVGKTEIARRLAKLVKAPFVKVEATKFTEVGYVGRDVESMIRELVEIALRLVQDEKMVAVKEEATVEANKRLVKLLVPELKKQKQVKNPFEMLFPNMDDDTDHDNEEQSASITEKREQIERLLALGELEDKVVEVEIEEQPPSMF